MFAASLGERGFGDGTRWRSANISSMSVNGNRARQLQTRIDQALERRVVAPHKQRNSNFSGRTLLDKGIVKGMMRRRSRSADQIRPNKTLLTCRDKWPNQRRRLQ